MAPEGFSDFDSDCNDLDVTIFPEQEELCERTAATV